MMPLYEAMVLLVVSGPSAASQQVPYVDARFVIDGQMDETAWKQALIVELEYETDPGENVSARVKTEVALLDTGRSFLVGFISTDPDPGAIRAFLRDRDAAYQDDFVGVVLDTFNDERRALEFFVNPLGSQMDLIQDDVNGNEDDSWDAIWDAAGQITESGFVVEMEIPYTALSLPPTEGEKTWGIDLLRFYPREQRYRLSNNINDRSRDCYLCQLDKFHGFANARSGRNLELTPSLVSSRNDVRDELQSDLENGEIEAEFSLDVKWGFTPNMILNATINPDFSQVEADVARLNVNETFSLFFPEKRPFFLENSDYFDTRINVLHTRNVAAPDYGARVTGKLGNGALGAFFAQDTQTQFLLPGSQSSEVAAVDLDSSNGVFRYRRDIGDNSSLGLIGTAREADGYHNYVGGIDGRLRFNGTDSLSFQALGSRTRYPPEVVEEFAQTADEIEGTAVSAGFDHETRDWFGLLRYDNFSEDFRADLGFVRKVNFERYVVGGGRIWYPDDKPDALWTRIQFSGDWDETKDQSGQLLERELEGRFNIELPLQTFVSVGAGRRDRYWDGVLFDEMFYSFFAEVTPRRGLYLNLGGRFGDQIDFANTELGEIFQLRPQLRWNIGSHLGVELRHVYEVLDRQQGELYTANLSDLRLAYQFDLKQRLRLVLQYSDIKRDPELYVDDVDRNSKGLGTQLIYSYKLNPRTLFFAGYGQENLEDDSVEQLVTSGRTFFIKLSYAWER